MKISKPTKAEKLITKFSAVIRLDAGKGHVEIIHPDKEEADRLARDIHAMLTKANTFHPLTNEELDEASRNDR